ncbi:MAG: glycosyltransferase family 39 protein [Solirubrobacterales bacterium]
MSGVAATLRGLIADGTWRRRLAAGFGRLRPTSTAEALLLVLVLAGIWLRIAAAVSWWPVTTTLSDAWPYAFYAETGPFDNPQHPPGYSALLALVGVVTREVAVPVLLQHLLGIASALLLFAAVRRLTGSPWPGLVPAAVVLLNGDQIYLEHSIMSEGPFVFLVSGSLYACVRALDEPQPWWRWPLAAAGLAVAATTVRAVGVFLIAGLIAALVVSRPRPWLPNWRTPAVIAGVAVALLVPYVTVIVANGDSFGIAPSSGWHLYHRVAPFADCEEFTPPEGTEALCESTPPAERLGGDFYLFDPESPAVREFEFIGREDRQVGAFARQVVLSQPTDYLEAVWLDLRAFFVPSAHAQIPFSGGALDPQLNWSAALPPYPNLDPRTEVDTERGMETFFDDFSVSKNRAGLELLRDVQRVLRFGATGLVITTALTLLGLLIGARRERVGVLLFGVGGLALLAAPTLSGVYVGRYMVPLAGLLAAGAAIAATSIVRAEADRRRVEDG